MANYCNAKIKFEGSKEKLEEIANLITKPGRFSSLSIDYSYLEPSLPGIENKFIFQLFGCDWYKFISDEYTEQEKQKFHKKVESLIKSEGWIGLRDGYINESARDVSVDLQENNLIIEVTFSWYCPTLFFFKIAQNFNVNVKILEFVEGQHTIISHFNDNKDCIDVLNNHENILNNQLFRNLSIELGLHKPSDLVATAIISNHFDLAKEIINQFNVTENDIRHSFQDMIKYTQDSFDIYQSSAFVNLDTNILENININEKVGLFNSIINNKSSLKNN